jgi:hypothetical protein
MTDTPETLAVGGATVTLNPSPVDAPSVQVARAGAKSIDVSDVNGRVITLKKPSPLASLDFTKAAGAAGMNQLYLAEVAHLKFVAAIDGTPVATPTTDSELRALYVRLGDEGNEAAQIGVYENFVTPEDNREAVKNS